MNKFALVAIAALLTTGVCMGQITNPSFEENFGVPNGWTNGPGIANVAFFTDAGMPTDSLRYVFFDNTGVGPATPHSGGVGSFGSAATGTASATTTFALGSAVNTRLEFDLVFLSNEPNIRPGSEQNDFVEVTIQMGGAAPYNIIRLDTSDLGAPPSVFGFQASNLVTGSVDIGAIFPTGTSTSLFTMAAHVGNVGDVTAPSRAYIDNLRLVPGTPFAEPSISFITGAGIVTLRVLTPTQQKVVRNVMSFTPATPTGSGPFVGLELDTFIFTCLTVGFPTGGLHVATDVNGVYELFIPISIGGLLPSMNFDYLTVVYDVSMNYETFTPPQNYIWGS